MGMLEARDISFSYDGKQKVLDSLSFQLKPGEIVAITGPTGSGKTTLAKCLSGFIPRIIEGDFSGSLIIDNKDVSELSVPEIAQIIGLVQQDPESQICTLDVSDEVAFGPENFLVEPDEIQDLVLSSLTAVESRHLHNRSTYALSGGEKQRVAIASILAIQPRYIILDEPSSSLDPRGTSALRQLLLELKNHNIGIICIEHRISTVLQLTNKVKHLSNGKLSDYHPEAQEKTRIFSPKLSRFDSNFVLISAKNVCFSYAKTYVVKEVTVDVCKGEIVALMGDNGSGKTTLVNIMGGLLEPNEGVIYVKGISLGNLDRKKIADTISLVFQNPNHQIFERTVWKEQILTQDILGIADEIAIEQSESILRGINLWNSKDRNPFSLSHGQKRRLNVSSVTAHNPDILLFDEPFVGQDQSGRMFITEIIQNKVQAGGAAVVITHDPSFALNYCTRILFMDKGSILLDGPPQTVLSRLEKMGQHEYVQSGAVY
jgi:energy-coupling factor transport system ATP-binding protein